MRGIDACRARLCGTTTTPSASPRTTSPQLTVTPPMATGKPTRPGTALDAGVRRQAAREYGQTDRSSAGDIARQAIDDDGGNALGLGAQRDVVADDGGAA